MALPKDIETRLFINGQFVKSSDGQKFKVRNPYSQATIAELYEATKEDVNLAVAAAKDAFPAWSALTPHERGVYLRSLGAEIRAHTSELAALDSAAMGRPVSGFLELESCTAQFDYYAEAAHDCKGTTSLHKTGFIQMTYVQPVGVVAAIIPWNVPIAMLIHKLAPALAAGCTVVLKSSEKAPLSSLFIAKLVQKVGFPPGTVNIISGHGNPAGSALSSHMDVRAISFTGSTATGRKIQAAAASSNLKRVYLELGGKSPCLVFEDADLEQAAAELSFSMRINSGQVCIATSRIYVQESVAPKFLEAYKKVFAQSVFGDPLDPKTQHGPQADETQFNRVMSYIEAAKKSGAKVELGGDVQTISSGGSKSFFVQPTIITDSSELAQSMKEEIFGPVVHVGTFKTEDEAIRKANDTEYGLYASAYTKDIDRGMRLSKALEAGVVAINATSPQMGSEMPFGGWKGSGVGREGYGYSLQNFLETKTVLIRMKPA